MIHPVECFVLPVDAVGGKGNRKSAVVRRYYSNSYPQPKWCDSEDHLGLCFHICQTIYWIERFVFFLSSLLILTFCKRAIKFMLPLQYHS